MKTTLQSRSALRALPPRVIDIVGRRFGRLVVVSYIERGRWSCLCDCGKSHEVRGCDLKSSHIRSCGCLHDEVSSKRMTKHGHARRGGKSPEYRTWRNMVLRCTNPKSPDYKYYGGRGITVCERWTESFESFIADVGLRPSSDHSIDRIDVNGHYEPSNVKWSTRSEQMANLRATVVLTIDGETLTTHEWSKRFGIPRVVINNRVNRGWDHRRAVTEPLRGWPKKKERA